MKKFMSIMLALALTAGVATVTLAQDAPKKEDTKKKKGGKKKGDAKADAKDGKDTAKKGKAKKGKDADTKESVRQLLEVRPRAGSLLEGYPPRLLFFHLEYDGLPIAHVMAGRQSQP